MKKRKVLTEVDKLPRGFREYTDDDIIPMQEIFNETANTGANSPVLQALTAEEIQLYLDYYRNDGLPVYVLERAGNIIGWLSINRFSWGTRACRNTGEVSIYVKKEHFGRGIGCRLAQASVFLGRLCNMETLVAWIMEENRDSQIVCQAMGSDLWCRLPKIARFGDKRTDVLLYGLSLS